jgi:hypothetical protein
MKAAWVLVLVISLPPNPTWGEPGADSKQANYDTQNDHQKPGHGKKHLQPRADKYIHRLPVEPRGLRASLWKVRSVEKPAERLRLASAS